jgi:ribosomal protein L11 methyltransferase
LNRVQGAVSVTTVPLREVAGTFAVVVANILAEELVRMGSELVGKLKRDGFLVLSGILTEKEGIVLEGFARFPLALVETTREAEWSCITYRRTR